MDRVISLSRQKLRLERGRDQPDLRKLLAHLCTVEQVEGWIRKNPPRRTAPSPAQEVAVTAQEHEPSSSTFHHWPTGDLRTTVTVVREVEGDYDSNGEDDDSTEESWNGSDTSDASEDSSVDMSADEHGFWHSDSTPSVTVSQDFAYHGAKASETWKSMPKLLSVEQYRELATMLCA